MLADSADVMDAISALDKDIEITEQRRYVATRKYPPARKWSSLMVGVKNGTIDTRSTLHMSYRSLLRLHSMIKNDTVFVCTGPRKQAESLEQLIVFLRYVATGKRHGDIAREFGCAVGAVGKYVNRVLTALEPITKKQVMWPNREQRKEISKANDGILRGCIGYIGSTKLPLHFPPGPDHKLLLNSKGFYSLSAQMVCTHDNRYGRVCGEFL